MSQSAQEKFAFKSTGPYRVYKWQEESYSLLEGDIKRKKAAIQTAKKLLKNGNFPKIVVQDDNHQIVFTQEKNNAEILKSDDRFRGFLRLILQANKMPANFRFAVLELFKSTYEEEFPNTPGDTWSPEEDEALKILWEFGAPSNTFIGEILGRTESSVSHRIIRLKLKAITSLKRPTIF